MGKFAFFAFMWNIRTVFYKNNSSSDGTNYELEGQIMGRIKNIVILIDLEYTPMPERPQDLRRMQ